MSVATQAEVGPVVTGGDVEAGVAQVLRDWLPSYLADAEEKHGLPRGSTPAPRGWALTGRDLAKMPSDQLPCIVILSGGIVSAPRKEGPPGALSAIWGVDVASVFAAAWGGSARRHAQLYAAVIRILLLQRPVAIGDTLAAIDLRAEGYDEMDFESSRSYSASVVSFNVEVREIGWASGGPPPFVTPPTDPTDPFEPWTPVTETEVSVENTPPD